MRREMQRGASIGSGLLAVGLAAVMTPAMASGAHVGGAFGKKIDNLLDKRLYCREARTTYYREAVNAFRTCFDDTHADYPYPSYFKGAGLWQGEYWGKMMLSAAKAIDYGAPAEFRDWARDEALKFVRTFQRTDGYLATYRDPDFLGGPKPDGKEVFCWNVWGRKYTLWALLELARTTETPELTAAAARLADHLIAQLKRLDRRLADTGYFHGLPSVSILKPMVLLCRATGERRYLDFARETVADMDRADGRHPNIVANAFGDKPVHAWYPDPKFWAKAYELMSCCEGLIEYSRVTGERRPLEAARRIAAKLEAREANVLGGAGYHDHFLDAQSRVNAITEICDVIHWVFLQAELYREDHDVARLDRIEYAMLNAYSAGVYREGKWGCHDVRSHGHRQCTAPFEVEMHYHGCCIANAPRGAVAYAELIAIEGTDGAAELNFYTDGTASAAGVDFEVRGNYPVEGEVTVTARASGGARKVAFRVPGWCREMKVDGERASGSRQTVEFAGTRTFVLSFDLTPVVHNRTDPAAANERDYAETFEMVSYCPESTFSAIFDRRAYVTRGPLLLAKCKATGMGDDEIFAPETVNGRGFRARTEKAPGCGTWGAWTLTLEGDGGSRTMRVTDYATAADYDDPRNSFSIWF